MTTEREPEGKSPGDAFFDTYEAKLKTARAMAFIANVMYSLNWFLGFCALTWASAVILGGLLTDLSQHDYFSVVALLLLEAVRLSTITFFSKLVTWRLVHGSTDPQRLIYSDAARQKLLGITHIIEQIVQFTVIAISILVPVRRLKDLQHLAQSQGKFDGMKISLRIFYVLVLVNAAIAGLAVIFSKNVVPFFVDSFCLQKFYEKVVWKGIDEGLLHSTDFELLSWAFQMQADEYRRNTRAPVVKELYGDMMKFLYYHPRNKGFEAAKVALESDDTFEREAAANIVGLWMALVLEVEPVQQKVEMEPVHQEGEVEPVEEPYTENVFSRLLMQKKLLAKLADALDNDESGRAASISFEKLVETDPEGMLRVRSEGGGETLANIFMDRIHETVRSKKPKKAITDIKAMIPLLTYLKLKDLLLEEKRNELEEYCTGAKIKVLKDDMWIIVTKYKMHLKRLQVVAAFAYNLLMTEEERNRTDLCVHLRVEPREKSHILEDEVTYLLMLLTATDVQLDDQLPIEWNGKVKRRAVTQNNMRKPLPWLARRTTALVATIVNLAILVVSSIYLVRHAHF